MKQSVKSNSKKGQKDVSFKNKAMVYYKNSIAPKITGVCSGCD